MAVVRIIWTDSNSPGIIGYNIYRENVKINTILVPIGIQKYDDNQAVKDANNKYTVQAVTDVTETTQETLDDNLIYITPVETVTPRVWTLIWEEDFSGGSVGEVRGFNGTTLAVVDGLLEATKAGNKPAINPNNPSGWVANGIYKLEFTLESHTNSYDPIISLMQTWSFPLRYVDPEQYNPLPYTDEFKFTRINTVISSGIVYFTTDDDAIVRFSNVKFFELI